MFFSRNSAQLIGFLRPELLDLHTLQISPGTQQSRGGSESGDVVVCAACILPERLNRHRGIVDAHSYRRQRRKQAAALRNDRAIQRICCGRQLRKLYLVAVKSTAGVSGVWLGIRCLTAMRRGTVGSLSVH